MTHFEFEGLVDGLVSTHERARCVMLGIKGSDIVGQDKEALTQTLHVVVDEIVDAVSELRSHLKGMRS